MMFSKVNDMGRRFWQPVYLSCLSLFFASLFLKTSASAQALPALTVRRIPFDYDTEQGAGLVIQARINNGPPLSFLLDTGTETYVMVEDRVVRSAHIPLTGEVYTMTPGNIRLSETTKQRFSIVGADEADRIDFLQLPLMTGALNLQNEKGTHGRLAGVVGMPLLASGSLQINFNTKSLYWDLHPQSPLPGALTFPLQSDSNEPRFYVTLPSPAANSTGPMIPLTTKQNKPSIRLVLDTGAQSSTLPIDLISRLNPSAAFLRISSNHVRDYLNIEWLVPDLSECGLNIKNIGVAEDASREPAIGIDILSRFQPTLDFSHQRLQLQPRQGVSWAVRERGFVGAHLSEKNVVDYVRPSSPAARAGVCAGMTVLTVDRRPLDAVLPVFQGDLVDGVAGTTAVLQVEEAGGKPRTIRVQRLSESDPATFLPVGIRVSPLRFPQGYGVIVDAILCSSVAYSSGLRAGDVIRSANANTLLTKTYNDAVAKLLPQIIAMLQKPSPLTLTVRHLGGKGVQTVTLPTAAMPLAALPSTPVTPLAKP